MLSASTASRLRRARDLLLASELDTLVLNGLTVVQQNAVFVIDPDRLRRAPAHLSRTHPVDSPPVERVPEQCTHPRHRTISPPAMKPPSG